jgi:hypothetical protein
MVDRFCTYYTSPLGHHSCRSETLTERMATRYRLRASEESEPVSVAAIMQTLRASTLRHCANIELRSLSKEWGSRRDFECAQWATRSCCRQRIWAGCYVARAFVGTYERHKVTRSIPHFDSVFLLVFTVTASIGICAVLLRCVSLLS